MKHVKFYEEDSSIGRIYRESGMVEAGQKTYCEESFGECFLN